MLPYVDFSFGLLDVKFWNHTAQIAGCKIRFTHVGVLSYFIRDDASGITTKALYIRYTHSTVHAVLYKGNCSWVSGSGAEGGLWHWVINTALRDDRVALSTGWRVRR